MSADYEWSNAKGFAHLFEEFFVPALFADWAELTVAAGNVTQGETVLDVACGTGVVARAAHRLTQDVVGLDISEDMLSVANEVQPSIQWRKGDVNHLPFADDSFDVVFCQFGLMFFSDKAGALRELQRVGGRVVVTVWEDLMRSPGYREFVEVLEREFGREPANILTSPFILGDTEVLSNLFVEAGLDPEITTHQTVARFPSIEAWITTDIRATPMSAMFDDPALEKLVVLAKQTLGGYENENGTVSFPAPGHIVSCL